MLLLLPGTGAILAPVLVGAPLPRLCRCPARGTGKVLGPLAPATRRVLGRSSYSVVLVLSESHGDLIAGVAVDVVLMDTAIGLAGQSIVVVRASRSCTASLQLLVPRSSHWVAGVEQCDAPACA